MSVWTGGQRKGVHEDRGVSRAGWPLFRPQCNFPRLPFTDVVHNGVVPLEDAELARIVREEPRRLCGHCFKVVDR